MLSSLKKVGIVEALPLLPHICSLSTFDFIRVSEFCSFNHAGVYGAHKARYISATPVLFNRSPPDFRGG
jgi:hypothetical protein